MPDAAPRPRPQAALTLARHRATATRQPGCAEHGAHTVIADRRNAAQTWQYSVFVTRGVGLLVGGRPLTAGEAVAALAAAS